MDSEAIVLCRISDLKQDDGYSLDAQEKYGVEYCQKNEFKIKKVFRFVETGSKSGKRHKFNNMISFIEEHFEQKKVPLRLVVEKPDRLTRNFTNREQLQKFVMGGNLEIHYYKDKRIFDRYCSPADIFTDDMMTSVSKYIALNIARETHKGMKQKAVSGWFPARPPLGYKNIREGKENKHGRKESTIIIDPETKNAVLRIFELRAVKKYSYVHIRGQILEEGLLPEKKAKNFHKSTVEGILQSPFYIGKYLWAEEWYKGKHELFVPTNWYEMVQDLRGAPQKKGPIGMFSHLISCGMEDCGCKIIYDPKEKTLKSSGKRVTYHYYHCSDAKRLHKYNKIKQANVSEAYLHERFTALVDSLNIDDDLAFRIYTSIKESEKVIDFKSKSEVVKIKKQLSELEKKEEAIYEDYQSGLLSRDACKRYIKKINDERAQARLELENSYNENSGAILKSSQELLELCKGLKEEWNSVSDEEKVLLLKRLCSNPTLCGTNIEYHLRKPFEILKIFKKKPDFLKWCPGPDLNWHVP